MKLAVRPLTLIAGLFLAGCGGTSTISVPINADDNVRADYTKVQVAAYRAAIIIEMKKVEYPYGVEPDFNNIDEERSAAQVIRAQAFCDDARTRGWSEARNAYEEQVLREALNSLPADFPSDSSTESEFRATMLPVVDAALNAVAAPGSFCPELAP